MLYIPLIELSSLIQEKSEVGAHCASRLPKTTEYVEYIEKIDTHVYLYIT